MAYRSDSSPSVDNAGVADEIEVHVELSGQTVRAGTLRLQLADAGEVACVFCYATSYLARADAYPLDPQLPLIARPFTSGAEREMFNAFWESAPDRWGQWLLNTRATHYSGPAAIIKSLSSFDYLLQVRDDFRQGALRFKRPDSEYFLVQGALAASELYDLPQIIYAADAVAAGRASSQQLNLVADAGAALGGARPKVTVLNKARKLSIAKFSLATSGDVWDVETWEKTTLDMAKAVGIDVPEYELLHCAGRRILIIERFDREAGRRLAYANAFSLLSALSSWSHSYLDLADWIVSNNPDPTGDLRQLWRRMLFSILVGNVDDHLGNHGFLRCTQTTLWRLAPAFDLNPSPHLDAGHKMVVSHGAEVPALRQALQVARKFHVRDEEAREVLTFMVDVVSDWTCFAAENEMDSNSLEVMRESLSQRISEARSLSASLPLPADRAVVGTTI